MADQSCLILTPKRNILYGGSATANVDTTYDADGLVNGVINDPVLSNAATFAGTLTAGAAGPVDLVVVASHNLPSGTVVTLGGGLSGTFAAPATRPNGQMKNFFKQVTLAPSVGSFTFSIAGGSVTPVVGQILAGQADTLDVLADLEWEWDQLADEPHEFESATGVAYNAIGRRFTASGYVSYTAMERITEWYEETESNTLPGVFVPWPERQDAILVTITGLRVRPIHFDLFLVSVMFREVKRLKWSTL